MLMNPPAKTVSENLLFLCKDADLPSKDIEKMSLLRNSIVIGMAVILKAHLKSLYGLSEEYVGINPCIPLSEQIYILKKMLKICSRKEKCFR